MFCETTIKLDLSASFLNINNNNNNNNSIGFDPSPDLFISVESGQ